jgi:hypothetical protein
MKRNLILVLAMALLLAVAVIPANAQATTTILDGTAAVTNTEPVVISWVSGDGTYDEVAHSWAVTTVGGGTLHLVLKATNTSPSSAYTVAATVTPVGAPVGVTATITPSQWIAIGGNKEFTLTVIVAADAPLTTSNFTFQFTR